VPSVQSSASILELSQTTENLTVYNQSTFDLDGHPVKNIINWYRDNQSITVLNMPFEGNLTAENNTKVRDYSGYGFNGTVSGSLLWNRTGGYDGKGAYFYNSSSANYITVPHNDSLTPENFTISFWYWSVLPPTGAPANPSWTVLFKWHSLSPSPFRRYGYSFSHGPTRQMNFQTGFGTISPNLLASTTLLENKTWYHIVGVFSAGNVKRLYVNGVEEANSTTSLSIIHSPHPLGIGKNTDPTFGGPSRAYGYIDEVQMFDRVISAEQIKAIYENRTDLIVSKDTIAGETWQACVTPNDGYDDGTELCSNTLVVKELNPPTITLISPENNTLNTASQTIFFSYNVTDETGIANCSLILNGIINLTNTTINNNANNNFTQTLPNGQYNWSVNCTDSSPSSNVEASAVFNLTVQESNPPAISGVILNATFTTNLTTENLTVYTDQDGNASLKLIYNWYANNNSLAVLNMPFEGNLTAENNTKVRDYTSKKNGTANSATWNATGGYDGRGAYAFDGVDDYVSFTRFSFFGSPGLTFAAWVKTNDSDNISFYAGNAALNVIGDNTTSVFLSFGVHGGKARYTHFDVSWLSVEGVTSVIDNEWHHIAVTHDKKSGRVVVYVDGQSEGTGTITFELTFPGVDIIGDGWLNADRFNGTIDDVMIFNKSLSAAQIKALYENRTDLLVSQETTLTEVWQACVTPNDGIEDGTETCSNTLEIINTIPTIDSVILNSSLGTKTTSENLTAYPVNVSDVEGDDLKNITSWYLDGAPFALVNMPFEGDRVRELASTKDYSGNGNNGTVANATWNATGGYDGKGAYEFDGDDYVNFNYFSFTGSAGLTFAAWVKANDSDATSGYAGNAALNVIGDSTPSIWLGFGIHGGKVRYTHWVGGWNFTDGATSVIDNNWHHIAVTHDKSTGAIVIYVNGQIDATRTLTFDLTFPGVNTIGGAAFTPDRFKGSIDAVLIFNKNG